MVEYRGFECYFRDIRKSCNVFVYRLNGNRLIYDRTVNCEASAIDRIYELRNQGQGNDGVYTIDTIIYGSYY